MTGRGGDNRDRGVEIGIVNPDSDAQHAVARLVAHRYRRGRATAAEALQVLAALGSTSPATQGVDVRNDAGRATESA